MPDNFVANPGAGGSTFAADEIGPVLYPRSKITIGADGVNDGDVSASNPMPVSGSVTVSNMVAQGLTDAQLRASVVPVSVSGVATETTLSALNTKTPALGQAAMASSQPVVIASNQSNVPTSNNATIFQFSTNNTSTAQLTAGATFTGVIETALDQPAISLLLTSDQPITITVKQFIDVGGTRAVPDIVFTVAANTGLSRSFTLNGNYVQVLAQNTGLATSTTFSLNTAYGNLGPADSTGILPVVATAAPLQSFSYSVAGVIAINTDLMVIDCLQLRSLFIQCNSMGTTGTVTVQWANDSAFAAPITATLLSETGASSTTFNAAVLRVTNVLARYCRLRLTVATTAGTTTINVWGAQTPYVPTVNQVTGSVSSNPVASTQLMGDVGVQLRATTPGTTLANVLTLATNNLAQLKGSAGKIAGGMLTNTTAALQFVKLFALPSASVTMGTTAATTQIALQPNQTVNLAQGDFGTFLGGTGVTYAVTTGSALADNTATTAGSVVGYILWI